MLYDFLKVSDDMLDARSRSLARLLTAKGRKTSPGDALLLMLRLDRYIVQQARDTAPDLRAELVAASTIPDASLTHVLSVACEWPERFMEELTETLQDRSVGVLEWAADGSWRVLGVAERYASFAEKRRDSRGRAAASRLAKEHGWVADGGGWVRPGTEQRAAGWRDLLTLLEAKS